LYKHIFTRFGCPLTFLTDQGTHFINDAVICLTNHFILRHTNSIVYYPQGNGHIKFTNNVFGTLLTKLVNENMSDLDEHLSIVLFHTELPTKLEQVIFHFSLCMDYIQYFPMEYLLPSRFGENIESQHVKVLTNQLLELEKLQDNKLIAQDLVASNKWNRSLWS